MFSDSNENNDWWVMAQKYLPGGVNAAARFNKLLGKSFLVSHGEGCFITDINGRKYIDMNMSYGASLLGYGDEAIVSSLEQAARDGVLCGHETHHQLWVAQKLAQIIPSAEMTRFCSTGTETTWHAIRLARAYTKKHWIVKFEGHFHGYNDYLGFSAWPPYSIETNKARCIPYPQTAGIPDWMEQHIIVLPFNDYDVLNNIVESRADEIAAIILEPVNYNSGTILPLPGYLQYLRKLTNSLGILLIFDEILSGFRTGLSCMQGYYRVIPDITILGKALGGGMPLSALTGNRDIMQMLAPVGPVVHSGTYIAHPTAIMAAEAFLKRAEKPDFYANLLKKSDYLCQELQNIFSSAQIPVKVQFLGARFSLLFGVSQDQEIRCYQDLAAVDMDLANRFYKLAFDEGIYFNPGWHHGISDAHTEDDIHFVLGKVGSIVKKLA